MRINQQNRFKVRDEKCHIELSFTSPKVVHSFNMIKLTSRNNPLIIIFENNEM